VLGPLRPFRFLRRIRFLLSIAVVALVLMQLVPYRLANPPTRSEPKWDRARTRQLAVLACFDCHSNESKHHWYTQVAPFSWLPVKDARDGRAKLNFSEWGTTSEHETRDLVEVVEEGSMPPARYTWFGLHKDAKLTERERAELAAGLRKTLGELDDESSGKGPG
jgi:Haem-binding domain